MAGREPSVTPVRLVVALGGHAILRPGERGTAAEQWRNIGVTARQVAELIRGGHEVIVTHGNGPQVGNIMLQQRAAEPAVPAMPLDLCVAQSQGMIGYMIQHALEVALAALDVPVPVAALVTRVEVEEDDPAFANPSKPVGPFFPAERARALMADHMFVMREEAGRGWRVVVPSPRPVAIRELSAIRALLAAGIAVIATGGGGIPVGRARPAASSGIEAVIDKDLAAARLASDLSADVLLLLTDVDAVRIHYGTPQERSLSRLGPKEGWAYLGSGYFHQGSMRPKVEAALRFVEDGGRRAVIASLDDAVAAMEGRAGTQVSA